jgi:hypothetical protein
VHVRLGPASLVLYDVSTLYFETDQGDGFREPRFSNYVKPAGVPHESGPCRLLLALLVEVGELADQKDPRGMCRVVLYKRHAVHRLPLSRYGASRRAAELGPPGDRDIVPAQGFQMIGLDQSPAFLTNCHRPAIRPPSKHGANMGTKWVQPGHEGKTCGL